jgi:hypothetical protein
VVFRWRSIPRSSPSALSRLRRLNGARDGSLRGGRRRRPNPSMERKPLRGFAALRPVLVPARHRRADSARGSAHLAPRWTARSRGGPLSSHAGATRHAVQQATGQDAAAWEVGRAGCRPVHPVTSRAPVGVEAKGNLRPRPVLQGARGPTVRPQGRTTRAQAEGGKHEPGQAAQPVIAADAVARAAEFTR